MFLWRGQGRTLLLKNPELSKGAHLLEAGGWEVWAPHPTASRFLVAKEVKNVAGLALKGVEGSRGGGFLGGSSRVALFTGRGGDGSTGMDAENRVEEL